MWWSQVSLAVLRSHMIPTKASSENFQILLSTFYDLKQITNYSEIYRLRFVSSHEGRFWEAREMAQRLKVLFLLKRTWGPFSVPPLSSSQFPVISFQGILKPFGPQWSFCMYMVRINSCRYTQLPKLLKEFSFKSWEDGSGVSKSNFSRGLKL